MKYALEERLALPLVGEGIGSTLCRSRPVRHAGLMVACGWLMASQGRERKSRKNEGERYCNHVETREVEAAWNYCSAFGGGGAEGGSEAEEARRKGGMGGVGGRRVYVKDSVGGKQWKE